jgi:urease accessory protein
MMRLTLTTTMSIERGKSGPPGDCGQRQPSPDLPPFGPSPPVTVRAGGGDASGNDLVHHPLPSAGRAREEALFPTHPAADEEGARVGALPLLVWLSPAFPVGSFAFSHGLEWAATSGDLRDASTVQGWIAALLAHGSARNDALLLAAAWRASPAGDAVGLAEINELALALAGSRERRLETSAQGNAFVAAIKAAWAREEIDRLEQWLVGDVAYPVAVALAAGAHRIELRATLEAYLLAVVSNLVSAVVRLGVIGQSDGQRVIAALIPGVRELAHAAEHSTLDDLGGAAFRSDLAALRHETQYTRLFRS